MSAGTHTQDSATRNKAIDQIVLVDTFIVPEESMPQLVEASRTIQGILKTLPGFVEGYLYEKRQGGGSPDIITTAVWESEEAYNNARKTAAAAFQARGIDPSAIMRTLNVRIDRGVYRRSPY